MRRIALTLVLNLLAAPAAALGPPACGPAQEGLVACMAGKMCECRFERGGQMTGRPGRFAWDCGAMRPNCPPDPTIAPAPGFAAPPGLWLAPGRQGPPRP